MAPAQHPDRLIGRVHALRADIAALDPAVIVASDCARLVTELSGLAKACTAAAARAAARAADAGQHRRAGHARPDTWLAAEQGVGLGQAQAALDAVRLIQTQNEQSGRLADTAQLVATGELSLPQAHEIARTETEAPGSETAMIDLARRDGLRRLRDEGRRRRLERADRDDLYRRQRRVRHFRHWTDELGMTCFSGALPPDTGVPLINRLDHLTDQIWRHHRRTEGPEGLEQRDAYMADALLALIGENAPSAAAGDVDDATASGPAVSGTPPGCLTEGPAGGHPDGNDPSPQRGSRDNSSSPKSPPGTATSPPGRGRTELVLVWDLMAYIRGHLLPGEVGHILGGGPIPDCVMRQLTADAFYKVVTHDGLDIRTIAHHGRHIPAQLRTALTLGPPPTFTGNPCRCGCGRVNGLDIDHKQPLAAGGLTSATNLEPKCRPSHTLKTDLDRAAGLLDPRSRAGP